MSEAERFLAKNRELSRRFFLRCGVIRRSGGLNTPSASAADLRIPVELSPALEKLERLLFHPLRTNLAMSLVGTQSHTPCPPEKKEGRAHPGNVEARSSLRSRKPRDSWSSIDEERWHGHRFPRSPETRGKACRSVRQDRDMPEYWLPAWNGDMGRCVPLRVVLWLTQPPARTFVEFSGTGYHNDDLETDVRRVPLPRGSRSRRSRDIGLRRSSSATN